RARDGGGAVTGTERERGSASVLVLGVGLCLLLVAGVFVTVATAVELRHRAQIGADAAALAGAMRVVEGPEVACARARQLAVANHTAIIACELSGADLTVTVGVAPPRALAAFGPVTAIARAGPVPAATGGGPNRGASVRQRGSP
ncbi:MAG TPA: Rv3654c family TadE-like protein, partial [Stackebrandtia sp.]|uniref:Rv3654c family TadE-like protein n=1 Tax=Stackebrandtia sp. TaxID=2023065 RepID=UPI002D2D240F